VIRKTKSPFKTSLAARPTALTDDQFADRTVRQCASEEQLHPQGDKRHRVEYSTKFYVVQLIGSWVNIVESAERTVRSRNAVRWVTFEKKEYQLQRAEKFKSFVSQFLQGGCYAYIGGIHIEREKHMRNIEPYPFIYITSTSALRTFTEMRRARSAPANKGVIR
jgi:hypothetical protein